MLETLLSMVLPPNYPNMTVKEVVAWMKSKSENPDPVWDSIRHRMVNAFVNDMVKGESEVSKGVESSIDALFESESFKQLDFMIQFALQQAVNMGKKRLEALREQGKEG